MYSLITVNEYILIVFIVLFFAMLILFIIYCKKHRIISQLLKNEQHKNVQLSSFMKFFSDTVSDTAKFDEVYSSIAYQIANITEAKGVCIYEQQNGDNLFPVGHTEAFPPLQHSKKFVLSKPRYASDSLKYEKIKLGEGIIGETAQNRQGLLLRNASVDKRLTAVNNIIPIYTLMTVPMIMEDKVTGVICAINNKNNKPFTNGQFDSLESMTKLVVLIHNILKE